MIGTNDINRNAAMTETTRLLEELLNLIWLRSGNDTMIIVSTIVPIGPCEFLQITFVWDTVLIEDPTADANSTIFPMANSQRRVMEYNGQVKNLINELKTARKNINIMHTPVSVSQKFPSNNKTLDSRYFILELPQILICLCCSLTKSLCSNTIVMIYYIQLQEATRK